LVGILETSVRPDFSEIAETEIYLEARKMNQARAEQVLRIDRLAFFAISRNGYMEERT
jgi:hypothetical protein